MPEYRGGHISGVQSRGSLQAHSRKVLTSAIICFRTAVAKTRTGGDWTGGLEQVGFRCSCVGLVRASSMAS